MSKRDFKQIAAAVAAEFRPQLDALADSPDTLPSGGMAAAKFVSDCCSARISEADTETGHVHLCNACGKPILYPKPDRGTAAPGTAARCWPVMAEVPLFTEAEVRERERAAFEAGWNYWGEAELEDAWVEYLEYLKHLASQKTEEPSP